jgi:hypothetical protein
LRLAAFDFLLHIFAGQSAAKTEKNLRTMGGFGLNIVIYLFTWALASGLMDCFVESIP